MHPAVVNEMEWRDVADLYRYWADSPPTHELVAAYLGVKPQPVTRAAPAPLDLSGFRDMKAALDSGRKAGRS
jgi:hypothetical protein